MVEKIKYLLLFFINLFPILSFSQPNNINGLSLWLKADYGVTYDSNYRVSEWNDASGNGYIFSQSNVNQQPLYMTSIDSMNHKPAIKFDNNTLKCYQGMYIGTIFILANYDYNTFQNYDGLFTIIEYSETNAIFAVGTRGGTAFWPLNGFVGNNFYVNNNKTFDFAPLKIPKICYGFINSGIPTYWSNAMIGQDRSVSDRFWHGNIYEVIIYDRILSFTEIEKVKNYLKEKYAMDF